MRDVIPTLKRWLDEGHRFALATVTQTWGSSPRPVGAVMGVREDGLVCGSVSGGCVESAVVEAGLTALGSGEARMLDFGALSDESVWEVGLSCGGRIQVFIDPDPAARPMWRSAFEAADRDEAAVLVTGFEPFEQFLWTPTGANSMPVRLVDLASDAYKEHQSAYAQDYFFHVLPPRDRLVIVGAVHIAIPLVRFAKELGFETVVIDPRPLLASEERFPVPPDRMIAAWPDAALADMRLTEETYTAVLTHDPKIDDVALAIFLRSPVAYIGALGSRMTQEKRRTELRSQGFGDEDLARIHGPIGLKIGARSPEEIALSVMAEIVQVRRARS